ncbi:myristoylated alanine-rich protein kinase C substrate a isoform X1 [Paramisgurnus dabryanus]|uniref:myristoylated alanine-rich protein kinase C substrate a isoform X1 n=1 Tax=Paramisgurnus dabryanus TaxID=90735 RepID=UPI0031F3B6C5
MGAQTSKTAGKGETVAEKPEEAAASPSKTNGQENGHVKVNGDPTSPAAEGEEECQANGSAAVEEAPKEKAEESAVEKEAEGEKVNTEPVTEGEAAKAEDGATPSTSTDTPKKKKRFSFKKSFKLSGFSFKKGKKETGEKEGVEEAATACEEANNEAPEAHEAPEKAEPASANDSDAKPETPVEKPVEEPKEASADAEEPKEETKPSEPECSLSHNETPATEEAVPAVQEVESTAE